MTTELKELSKLAWRALVEAERVIATIEPEDDTSADNLRDLMTRLQHISQNLFYVLRLNQDDVESLP